MVKSALRGSQVNWDHETVRGLMVVTDGDLHPGFVPMTILESTGICTGDLRRLEPGKSGGMHQSANSQVRRDISEWPIIRLASLIEAFLWSLGD